MKKTKVFVIFLLLISLISLPVVADAHWRGGGGVIAGFGAGLITGYLFAPRPVYVAPPVTVAPPPAYYPSYVPTPAPPVSGYSSSAGAVVLPPGTHQTCREWRMIDRHLETRWDSYYRGWRQVPVEKWGWVEVPCPN